MTEQEKRERDQRERDRMEEKRRKQAIGPEAYRDSSGKIDYCSYTDDGYDCEPGGDQRR